MPNGSTVCRGQMALEPAKCGKASLPLPHKGQGRPLSLPLPAVPVVSPERSLTYSPGSQGSCKRNPLPPGSPFLDFRTCKVQSRPQRKLPPTSRKLSRIFPARPPPTGSAVARDEGSGRGVGVGRGRPRLPPRSPGAPLARAGRLWSASPAVLGPERSASEFSRRRRRL